MAFREKLVISLFSWIKKYAKNEYARSSSAERHRQKNPDIRGVFAFNDMMALGVADAAALAKIRRPFIVGFNGSLQGINAIQEGRIDATVDQNPREIGALAVENALRLMKGEQVPAQVFTRTEIIVREKNKKGVSCSCGDGIPVFIPSGISPPFPRLPCFP